VKLFKNKLLLIALVCVAPVALSTLAYFFDWAPGAKGNYGELIEPRPLSGPPLDALRGKWVLVSIDAAACAASCERKLYFMRQLRKTQGKEQTRIERLWLLSDAGAPRPELLAAIEGTHVARAGSADFLKSFPGEPSAHIYLVDPLGNLMLRFPRDPEPSKMIKDLQRLLRYSRIG
jgi:cytochrome oxidase Cu insertion factor (SCO1/SenC/PrrC family)